MPAYRSNPIEAAMPKAAGAMLLKAPAAADAAPRGVAAIARPGMLSRVSRRLVGVLLALILVPLMQACSPVSPQRYAAEKPALDLKQYFSGNVVGHGMFVSRSGEVARRFVVTITPTWNGDSGTLDERFEWSDGEKQQRIWMLQRQADGTWEGRAPDVLGKAKGVVAGNALNWRYTLALKTEGRTWEIDFDDWMFLIDDRVMMNRAALTFWGFRAGEVLISFERQT